MHYPQIARAFSQAVKTAAGNNTKLAFAGCSSPAAQWPSGGSRRRPTWCCFSSDFSRPTRHCAHSASLHILPPMMKRGPRSLHRRLYLLRSLAFLVVSCLAAATGREAFGFDGCPHHDVRGFSEVAPPHGEDQHSSAGHHAAEAPDHHDDSERGHRCTCIGTCHGSSPVAATRESGPPVLRTEIATAASHLSADLIRPDPLAYLLPDANAPPVSG